MNLEKFENLTRERNSLDIDEIFKNDDKPSMSRFSGNKKDEGCTLRETWHVEDVTPRDMVEIQIVKSGEISQTDHAERKEVMDGYINETGAMVLGEVTKSYEKEEKALHHRNFEREEISKVERKDDSIDLNSSKGTLIEDEICMSCGSHLTKMENGETESVNKGSFEKKYSSLETSDQEIIGTGDLACNDKEVQICEENLCLSEGLEETKIESSEFVESLQGINEESKLFPRVSHEIQYPLGRILLNQRGTVFDTAKGTRYIITTLFGYSILIDVDIDFVHRCHGSLEEKLSNGNSCDGEKKVEEPGEFLSHETILVQHLSDGEEVMFDAVVPTNTSVSSGFRAIVLWQGMKPDSVVSPLENTLIVFRGIEGCCVKINSLQRRCGQINVSFYGREIKVTFYINVVYISGKKCTMQSLRQKHKTHTVYANVYELGNGWKRGEYICSCLWIDEAPQNVETKLLPFTPYVKTKPSLVTEGGHHKKLLLDCPALLCKKIDRTDGTVQVCVDSSDTTVSRSPGYFVGIGTIDSQEGKHLFFSLKKDEKAFCFQVPSVFLGIHKEMLEKSTKELLSTVHIIRIVLEEVSHEVAAFQLLACELNRAMKEKGSMVCKEIQKWMVTECGEENITKTERERSAVLEKQEVECKRRKKVVNVEKNCEDTKVREQKEVKSVLKGPHKLKKPWRKEEQDCSEGLECIGGSFKEDTEMTISPQKAETCGEINDQTVFKEIQKWMVTECGEENITKTERERSAVLEKQEVECQRRKKVVNVEENCEDTKVREQKEVKSVLKGPHKLKKPWRKEEQDCSEGIGGSFKEDTEMTISPQKAETSGEINDQTVFEASVSSLSQASTSSCSSDVSSSDLPCVLWNCKGVIKKVSKSLIIETNWSNENISIKIGKHCNISVNGKLFSLRSLENGFVLHFDAIKEKKKWKPLLLWKDVKPSFLVLKTGGTVFYDLPALVVHSDRKSIVLRFYEGFGWVDIETDIPDYMYTTHGSHIPKIQAGMWVIVHLNREMLHMKITSFTVKLSISLLLVPEEEELTNRLHTFNAEHVFDTMFYRVSFLEALIREEFLYHETKMKMIGEEEAKKHREMTMHNGEKEQIFNEVNVRVKKDCPANENEEKIWTGKQKYLKTANVDLAEKVNLVDTNVVHDRLGVYQGVRVEQCKKMKAHVGDKVEGAKGKCRDVSLNTRELEEEMRKQVQRSEQGQHKHTSEGEQEGESKERKSREIIKEKKTEIQRMQEEMVKQNIDKKEVHTAEREQHTLKNEIFKDEQEMHKQKQKVQDTQNQERKHAEDRKQFEEKKEDSNQQMKLVSFMAEKPVEGHYKDRKIKEEIQRSKEVEVITKLEEKQNQEEERKRKMGKKF
ncbi:uncharacterized protein LOC143017818 [Oratosquilla oratoria]|uniref:uncharacterized protein LOC143017818 n=1 Tax=Oratosquilla oratoria TaxID=337810 RepID=UPI003F767C2C